MASLPPIHLISALCIAVCAMPLRADTPWLSVAALLLLIGGGLPRPAGAPLIALAMPMAAQGQGMPLALWAVAAQWTRTRLSALPLLTLAWFLWWRGPHGLGDQALPAGIILTSLALWAEARSQPEPSWMPTEPTPPAIAPRHLAAEAQRLSRTLLQRLTERTDTPTDPTLALARELARIQEDVVDVLDEQDAPLPLQTRTPVSLRALLEDVLTSQSPHKPTTDVLLAIPPAIDDHLLLDQASATRLLRTAVRVMERHGRGSALRMRVIPTPQSLLLRMTWAGHLSPDSPPVNHDGAPEDERLLQRHALAAGATMSGLALCQPLPTINLAFAWQPWWKAPAQPEHPRKVWVQAQDGPSSLAVRLDLERLGHVRVMDPEQADMTVSVVPRGAAPPETWISALARSKAPAPYILILPPSKTSGSSDGPPPTGTHLLRRPWRLDELAAVLQHAGPAPQSTPNRPGASERPQTPET